MTSIINLNVCDEENPNYMELEPLTVVQTKIMRPTPTRNFKAIQLYHNPLRIVNIGSDLHTVFREGLMNCLKANAILFVVSPSEIPR